MQQRSEFRIVYPLPARPVATIADRRFSALDVSEHAMRLDQRHVPRPLVAGERVAGRICLAQQVEHAFEGCVLRLESNAAVVLLDERFRIDLSVIFQEQRYLRSRFPDWR
ncbi:MAG: PilZ domain-containing protein [Gammaproteobacteria bacterium]|nr:PilZ domain-containing protein [Gammaproteobacteria bacterium]